MTGRPAVVRSGARARLDLWIRAARPRTLTISLAPILVGAAHAVAVFGTFRALPVAAATVAAVAIQVATNLANDAADGERGLDGPGRLGPPRVTGSGLATPAETRRAAVLASVAAALAGLVAVYYGGVPILMIGVASLAAAWAYSNGPRPISASATGEGFVIAFFGVAAVVGIEWLAAAAVDPAAIALGVAIGLPAAAVLTVNNHRDRVQDAGNGRRTLAIRLGVEGTRRLYAAELLAAPILAAATLAPDHPLGAPAVLATLVPALGLARRLAATPIGRGLNTHLAATGAYQLLLAGAVAAVLLGGF